MSEELILEISEDFIHNLVVSVLDIPLLSPYFLKLFFNWRKIAFWCCVGLCHTTMQISRNYIYISPHPWASLPSSTSCPSRSSQSTWLGSLCYMAISHQLSVLHIVVYTCLCYFLCLSHCFLPLLCPPWYLIYIPDKDLDTIPDTFWDNISNIGI